MEDLYQWIQEAAAFLKRTVDFKPDAGIILGTGLGGVAERLEIAERIPYSRIPHFLESTVEGHSGHLVFGKLANRPVVVMQGRFHSYEGYSMHQITLPVRLMHALGARYLFVNSAAGGLNPQFVPGDIMIVTDHLNLMGQNPLRGMVDPRLGDRFPEMSCAYDREMIRIALNAALDLKMHLQAGVYAAVQGPCLETPAETRMLRILGADAVGMSTVPEVIVAVQCRMRTMVLAAITNVNLPDCMKPVSVQEVIANASIAEPKISLLIQETLLRLTFDETIEV
ncbi:purine-nucleoside phosphorylase [Desulfomonile tiedjei]|uniref:Purine nucleoside phosphorylase n=1 Tax=Desulfomonile tiedjei (strain ATCC 49306 / DSM 6799 / DCB-1) TaxID=706587 RepID=I4C8H8_DESTA|nr:purine-nucleoside phosphorylase [Desulfomonile tiedjei]AFM25869.1 purine nucleoside phosphorylase I, inosine and guanosine-specific [Desulfomonile tiedjei DSM 6799]